MPAPQQPIELGTAPAPAPESVVEFGAPPPQRRRRWSSTGLVHQLAADRRLVPIAACLAALAVFASFVSEWQITTVGRARSEGDAAARPPSDRAAVLLLTDPADLGVLGTGYLVGVFLVVPTVVLTLFGPAATRQLARLIGLSLGGTLLSLVLALVMTLGEQSRTIPVLYNVEAAEGDIQVSYGRGLWCALAGVLLTLLALYLAGRHLPQRTAEPAAGEPPAGEQPAAEPAGAWTWRRPPARPGGEDDNPTVAESLELTVSPAKPFTSLTDDRDKPTPT